MGEREKQRQLQMQEIREHVLPRLNEVVLGEVERWSSGFHFPVILLRDVLEEDGFSTDMSSMQTNGWQWDWWIDVEKDGKPFTLVGSGYYGGLSFHPSEKGM